MFTITVYFPHISVMFTWLREHHFDVSNTTFRPSTILGQMVAECTVTPTHPEHSGDIRE